MPQPKINKVDELIAVATGVEECPIEDSTTLVEELFPCDEGCGRMFTKKALEKHLPICKKVFQTKRNEFNAESKRIIDNEQPKLQRAAKIKDKVSKKETKEIKTNWK